MTLAQNISHQSKRPKQPNHNNKVSSKLRHLPIPSDTKQSASASSKPQSSNILFTQPQSPVHAKKKQKTQPTIAAISSRLAPNKAASTSSPDPNKSSEKPRRSVTPCKRTAETMLGLGKSDKRTSTAAASNHASNSQSHPQSHNPDHDPDLDLPHHSQPHPMTDDSINLDAAASSAKQEPTVTKQEAPTVKVEDATPGVMQFNFPSMHPNRSAPPPRGHSILNVHRSHLTRPRADVGEDVEHDDRSQQPQPPQQHLLHHHQHDNEQMSTAHRLCEVTIESPGSPGGYKRMRSSADSDAGSSSCKDIDESDVLAPDSVPALCAQLRQLLDYVASKPTLQHGSASFMRDYLRTLLIQNSAAAEEAIELANKTEKMERLSQQQQKQEDVLIESDKKDMFNTNGLHLNSHHHSTPFHHHTPRKYEEYFKLIPDELAKHILSFLDGKNLATAREVCRRWDDFACDEQLWKTLVIRRWRSLEHDEALWKLIDREREREQQQLQHLEQQGQGQGQGQVQGQGQGQAQDGGQVQGQVKSEKLLASDSKSMKWRLIYPKVFRTPQWKCRLQKTGRFICNLVAHQISGTPLLESSGLPDVLVVERRFNIMHLATFVLQDASVLYFEPEKESDRAGFEDFIQYLDKRTRAGLALEDQRRFIFIPPCDYTRNQVGYQGNSLLGVVQNAYPPLAP